jgi:hypothetical protein
VHTTTSVHTHGDIDFIFDTGAAATNDFDVRIPTAG